MKNIVLIIISFATMLNADFRRDSDRNTVIDNTNNLEWIDDSTHGTGIKKWQDANTFCENSNHAGESDWRLPTINELMTLADYDKTGVAYNSTFRYNKSSSYTYFWSSTKVTGNDTDFWSLKFEPGNTFNAHYSKSYYSRCVRVTQ